MDGLLNNQDLMNMTNELNATDVVEKALEIAIEKFNKENYDVAEMILLQALKIDDSNKKILVLLSHIKHLQSRFEEAIVYLKKAIELQPDSFELINNLAMCYSAIDNHEEAIVSFIKAISINPKSVEALKGVALEYRCIEDYENAILYFNKAIEVKENEELWTLLGGCYAHIRMFSEAEICLKEALSLNPNFHAAGLDLSLIYHKQGNFEKAWTLYEHRLDLYDQFHGYKKAYDPKKKWNGTFKDGMRLLIYGEQGLGDIIQFARYLPKLRAKGIYVILNCDRTLSKLLQNFADEFFDKDPNGLPPFQEAKFEVPHYDCHCSLLSLPFILKTNEIPPSPYLFVKEIHDFKMNHKLKVGLVWAGNPHHPNDKNRSLYLKSLSKLQDVPNVQLFGLVKDTRPRKYKEKKELVDLIEDTDGMDMVDLSELMTDFYSTATFVNGIDLIVTVDTSLLHLAGAMGKTTLALLPYDSDWRWGLEEEKTKWYSSVKLLRQNADRTWEPVIERLIDEIRSIQAQRF